MSVSFRFLQALVLLPALSQGVAAEPLRVFVGIEPLQYLVAEVGGEGVDVTVVVKGNQRPETYEPSPRQIAALASADVFFGVGMPLENAWREQLRVSGGRSPGWVDLSAGLNGARHEPAPDEGGSMEAHAHGEFDPHVWLSPVHAQRMAMKIGDVLSELAPGRRDYFRRNAAALRNALAELDREIQSIIDASGVEAFMVFHPAWGHFARRYGLEQIAVESGGKEPGTRAMIEVIDRAKAAGIRTLFVDPRHSTRLAETVAESIGAGIRMIDPLSPYYMQNLRRAARAIAASG